MKRIANKGFSLVELMIVVALISILASVAIPSYSRFITDARRSDGHHLLRLNALRLERCFTLEGSYNGSCFLVTDSEDGYYTLTSQLTRLTYQLTAVATTKNGQNNDTDCSGMSLDNVGRVSATGSLGADCW